MKNDLRDRVIREWRGLSSDQSRPDRAVHVREVLLQLAPKLGLAERLREEEMVEAWSSVVGNFFAAHSRPHRLQRDILMVNVLQPTVLYELDRNWKPMILEKLRARFGSRIRMIKFRLG